MAQSVRLFVLPETLMLVEEHGLPVHFPRSACNEQGCFVRNDFKSFENCKFFRIFSIFPDFPFLPQPKTSNLGDVCAEKPNAENKKARPF